MSNNYTIFTAMDTVPMAEVDASRLNELLVAAEEKAGCQVEWNDGEGYFVSDDNGVSNSDNLSDEFLTEFGRLIGGAGMPFLTVGVAFTCDKWCEGSHGGAEFRIYPDGQLVYMQQSYPEYTPGSMPLQKDVACEIPCEPDPTVNYAPLPHLTVHNVFLKWEGNETAQLFAPINDMVLSGTPMDGESDDEMELATEQVFFGQPL
jgi:hypothetical protein